MKFGDITSWAEAHPGEAIAIGAVGVIGLMWLLGFFSSSSSSSSAASSGNNLAAAYYAAEAQQAVVGGQIQQANIAATASTAQANIAANAAIRINGQNTNAATTQNASNNATAATLDQANNNAGLLQTYLGTTLPTELGVYGNVPIYNYVPGVGGLETSQIGSPTSLAAGGWSQQQISDFMKYGLPGIPATGGPS